METGINLAIADIDVGFATTATLTRALKEKKLIQPQIMSSKKECGGMLATIVTKIQVRSPLKYNIARNLASLDPRPIVAEPDTAVQILNRYFQSLLTQNREQLNRADGILTQCKIFVSEMKQFHHEKLAGFNFGEDRLDAFFFDVFNTQKTYEDLWDYS